MKEQVLEIIAAALSFISGLVPGAIGAAVSVYIKKTLTWAERFLEFTIGIVASYVVAQAVDFYTTWPSFIASSISFTAGFVALDALKKFREGFINVAGEAPRDIWGIIKSKLGGGPATPPPAEPRDEG